MTGKVHYSVGGSNRIVRQNDLADLHGGAVGDKRFGAAIIGKIKNGMPVIILSGKECFPKQINMEQSDGKFKRYSKRTKVNMAIVAFMLFCGKPVS